MGRTGFIALTLLFLLLMVHVHAQPQPLGKLLAKEHRTNDESLEKLHGEAGKKRVKTIIRKGGVNGARGGGGGRGGGGSGGWGRGGGGGDGGRSRRIPLRGGRGWRGHHRGGANSNKINSHWCIITFLLSLYFFY